MKTFENVKTEYQRIEGKLYENVMILDDEGKTLRTLHVPLKVDMKIRDYLEVIVGASILAIPVAFTEEVWDLGQNLPLVNVFLLSLVGFIFMAGFIYYSAYRRRIKMFKWEFLKRVLSTFLLAIIVVGLLLTIVNKCPWITDFDIALKRVLIGAFPASMSATVTDSIS